MEATGIMSPIIVLLIIVLAVIADYFLFDVEKKRGMYMESKEISNMRLKQVAVTNGLILASIIILFTVINVFTIKFAHFFFVLGLLILIQGIYGFIKGDSTKSFIPIFEKVAIYEKQKMGMNGIRKKRGEMFGG